MRLTKVEHIWGRPPIGVISPEIFSTKIKNGFYAVSAYLSSCIKSRIFLMYYSKNS